MDDLDDGTLALLKLALAGGAMATRRDLLDAHGGDAVAAAAAASRRSGGLDENQRARLATPPPEAWQASLDWLRQPRRHLIGWNSPDYPALLRRIASPPLALFVEGDPTLLWRPAVAVVGSRSPTAGGRDNARDFSRALAAAGVAVISGMAAGIDTAAHAAALAIKGGVTVAVLGTGPDLAYPPGNAELRARIAERGAVVSEYAPGTQARPGHFPSRNRILAGLALGILVVEAAERSGALITARQAADGGREVFAVPGSIHNPLARGCHRLIRDGAALVETAGEVLAGVAPLADELAAALRGRLSDAPANPLWERAGGPSAASGDPDPDYHKLWQALGHDPTGMDALLERTGLTTAELSSMLLVMELDGRVAVEHGRYSRKP
ncbi:MAG: DNA-processing protein DprA [Pseudoxanthomonas sp.]